jgi:hypothetical protein
VESETQLRARFTRKNSKWNPGRRLGTVGGKRQWNEMWYQMSGPGTGKPQLKIINTFTSWSTP